MENKIISIHHRHIQENEYKILQINSMPDHIHIFFDMRPYQSISTLIQNVKTESSKWVKNNKFCKSPFAWQGGLGAFSYSKTHVDRVIRYIQNQEAHHKKETFLDECCLRRISMCSRPPRE